MHRAILVNIFLILAYCLSAQLNEQLLPENKEGSLLVKEWSVNTGLTSNSIGKIGKTKEGFLFICTFNGISFFDGKNFQNYNSLNAPALKTNIISDFCIDKDSTFWIGTYRGVVVFKDNEFTAPENLKELESTNIQCIDIDKNGTLWIGTVANGLFKYENGKLEKVKEIALLEKSIVSLVYSDNEGSTWIGTESGLLYRYAGNKYTQIFHDRIENSMLSAAQG
jgi:ligand-binding sensor domain-containing protein